jgi:hypothetical protein
MPTLNQTQTLLWKLITAPEGAAAGRAALPAAERAACESLVRSDHRLSAIERIDIYADMYFYRIRDALKDDFAAVSTVIGEARFHNLITDYLLAHPPTHFSLRYAGEHLPAFLARHDYSERWPYLPDLALLEWGVLEAFDAPDAPVLEAATLQSIPAARWPELRFRLSPSLQRLRLGWTVDEIRRQSEAGLPLGEPRREDTVVRVWRRDWNVLYCRMDAAETAALAAVADGAPFAEACEQILACDATTPGAERAFALVTRWLGDALLAGVS